jgi:hypothetical protein
MFADGIPGIGTVHQYGKHGYTRLYNLTGSESDTLNSIL